MPDTRRHRGQHPDDAKLFTDQVVPALREAVSDLSWLLTRGYSEQSAAVLVGDRYRLTARQRLAVQRAACSDTALLHRQSTCLHIDGVRGQVSAIDGFNLLIILESALSGGNIFIGRDGSYRDLASIHGTYRAVEETATALELVGATLEQIGVAGVCWYLDAPVSNSGRLKMTLLVLAEERGWPWKVEVINNPDRALVESGCVIVSSDSWVVDRAPAWINLAQHIIDRHIPSARIIDLR
jgi:hypothetical protein